MLICSYVKILMTSASLSRHDKLIMLKSFFAFMLLSLGLAFAQPDTFIQGSYLEEDLLLSNRLFLGDTSAPISVVIFEDFGCPHCQSFNQNLFAEFKENYIDTGFVKLYFLQFPIPVNAYSDMAALASECVAEQDGAAFWPYKSLLYETTLTPSRHGASVTALKFWRLTAALGNIDQAAFMSCMLEERHLGKIQEDRQLGINVGVQGTPAMLIDTEAILNPNNYDLLSRVLNDYVDALE